MFSTIVLMQRYADKRGIALSTLGRLTVGSSTVADRMRAGRVTIGTVVRIEQWLSDHWPDDLAWPADIPRPPPSGREDAA